MGWCGGVLFGQGAQLLSGSAAGLVIHDIKEVEGVRQQEEQEERRDEEIGDEVNGEGRKRSLTVRMKHEYDDGVNRDSNLSRLESDSVRASVKEDSQRTTTLTDNKKERLRKRNIFNA